MIRRHNLKDIDCERHFCFCQWFLDQCSNQRFLANFLISDETGCALNGAVNNHNVRMYASANQLPDFHYNVDDGCQKLTDLVRLCGSGNLLGPFLFDKNT